MKKRYKCLVGMCMMMFALVFTAPMKTEAAYNADGTRVTGNSDWKWPVPNSNTLSSCYIDGRSHYAIDIVAAKGTPIYSCYEGEVISTYTSCTHNYGKSSGCGCNGNLGNSVYVRHNYNGVDYVSRYGHLTDVYVSVGTKVTKDTVIGTMGSTGMSGNNHLDLRIYQGSTKSHVASKDAVDPLKDLFLEIPEGINSRAASTGCCYAYNKEVTAVYNEIQAQKAAEEAARQQAEFEQALRDFADTEVTAKDNYYGVRLVELELGLQQFVSNYN